MKVHYVETQNVTKELLDSIAVGDLVKFNGEKKPFKVNGVSANYFLASRPHFSKFLYSVCEKKPAKFTHNLYTKGCFNISKDDRVFGAMADNRIGYFFNDPDWCAKYLALFESGEYKLSVRVACPVSSIAIKMS